MKKIVFEKHEETIHISDITVNRCIIAFKNNAIYGSIISYSDFWIGVDLYENKHWSKDLKHVTNNLFSDCELFVL